jgi:hypothetical protein
MKLRDRHINTARRLLSGGDLLLHTGNVQVIDDLVEYGFPIRRRNDIARISDADRVRAIGMFADLPKPRTWSLGQVFANGRVF